MIDGMTQQPIAPLIHLVGRNQDEPTDCRRRLLLARAACQLRYTARPIIDIAFCAYRHLLRCTGRSVRGQRSDIDRPETIDETAERGSWILWSMMFGEARRWSSLAKHFGRWIGKADPGRYVKVGEGIELWAHGLWLCNKAFRRTGGRLPC